MTHAPPTVHVFHTGALGDSVLAWPLLRRLRHAARVTFITEGAKGKLAARELGIKTLDSNHPRFARLWNSNHLAGDGTDRDRPPPGPVFGAGVSRVVSFLTDDPSSVWAANARRVYPDATIELHRAPIDRLAALALAGGVTPYGALVPRPTGPVVLHVGAGSCEKRWPIERWVELADHARKSPWSCPSGLVERGLMLMAGEAELERFSASDRSLFEGSGGRFVQELDELATRLCDARLFVGNDSGPSHLAAQFGVPTVALFGPTDPARWAPIGPCVKVVAPPTPRPMSWLSVEDCAARVAGTMYG